MQVGCALPQWSALIYRISSLAYLPTLSTLSSCVYYYASNGKLPTLPLYSIDYSTNVNSAYEFRKSCVYG